ncbi:MAG: hypothetical protein QM308_01730 [Bacillota bacterium]|nr:hypothetical protein [Bacillota bacterium]
MAQVIINLTDRLVTSTYKAQRSILGNYTQVTTPTTATSAAQTVTVPPASKINWVKINFTRNSPAHGTALHQIVVDGEVAHAGGVITSGAQLSKALFNPGNHTIAVRFKSKTAGTSYGYGTWQTNSSQLNQTSAYLTIDYEGPDTGGDAPPSAVKSGLTLGAGGVKCGNTIRFNIVNQSPGVYHKARVGISGLTLIDEIVPKGATFFDFEVPYGWQQYIAPNGTARYSTDGVYARLFTYSDPARTQQIGFSDQPMYIAISDDNRPVIDEFTDMVIPLHSDAGLTNYIQRYTQIQMTAMAQGLFNATIQSYKFTSGAWTQSILAADLVGDELPSAITPPITQSGTIPLTLEVTDTRNRKSSQTISITVTPYTEPALVNPDVFRSNDLGEHAATGQYITIQTGGGVASLDNLNTSTLKARVTQKGQTPIAWDDAAILTLTADTPLTVSGISIDLSYSVEIQIADRLAEFVFTADIGTAKAIISGLPGVTGVAIGKIADTAGILDIALPKGLMDGNPLAYYPIGAVYISTVSTNPGNIFGGVWEALATGKALVGVDPNDSDFTAGVAGGSKRGAVTGIAKLGVSSTSLWVKRKTQSWAADGKGTLAGSVAANSDNLSSGIELDATASTLQPYLPVYIWTRTA